MNKKINPEIVGTKRKYRVALAGNNNQLSGDFRLFNTHFSITQATC